jgi:hypothetical protein
MPTPRIASTVRRAVPAGPYQGRTIYRVPVRVAPCDPEAETQGLRAPVTEHLVLAPSAADAANWALRHLLDGIGTVTAYGPKGGETVRTRGWYSLIADTFWAGADRQARQQRLW